MLLIADFVRTHAKNVKNEIVMGCSVFPGVALCFIQANVLFAEEGSGIRLIFTVPFDHHRMLWGPFNEAGVLGLARSSSLWRQWGCCWAARRGSASATGSAFSPSPSRWPRRCCWSKAVSGSITPIFGGGPFICFWVFWLESVSVFLQQTRTGAVPRWRLAVCAAALTWHIVSGVCFLVMLLQGVSYNVPILTYNLW